MENKAVQTKETDSPAGNIKEKSETTPLIERAREEREKLEITIKSLKEENDRREKLMTQQALGGATEAGSLQVEKKELTPKEYAIKVLSGKLE